MPIRTFVETSSMAVLEFIFSDFWIWLGFTIIFLSGVIFFYQLFSRTMRHKVLMKHGYPPPHCNADGNAPDDDEDEDDEEKAE